MKLIISTSGTTGLSLFEQDETLGETHDLLCAAFGLKGKQTNGYDFGEFMLLLGFKDRKKLRDFIDKKMFSKAVSKAIGAIHDVPYADYFSLQKKMKSTKDEEKQAQFEEDLNVAVDEIQETLAMNDYNPWPAALAPIALAVYICGYKQPPQIVKALQNWLAFEKAEGNSEARWLKVFQKFVTGVTKGPLDPKIVGLKAIQKYHNPSSVASDKKLVRALVKVRLLPPEASKSNNAAVTDMLKKLLKEWSSKK